MHFAKFRSASPAESDGNASGRTAGSVVHYLRTARLTPMAEAAAKQRDGMEL